jgi:hypothetical protein
MMPCETRTDSVGRTGVVLFLSVMLFETGSSDPLVSLFCLLTHDSNVGLDGVQSGTVP